MGRLGFSYVGLLFLLMLILPNLLWTRHRPAGYDPAGENRRLVAAERVGQVLVTCTALVFEDFNLRPWSPWSLWLVAAVLLMLLYECWWVRYFRSKKTLADFYSSFLGIPVAGATLPVAAFFLLGIYGRVVWMLLAVTILGIGHIGIHLQHRGQMGGHKVLETPSGPPTVTLVKEYPETVDAWNGPGVIFRVQNGQGRLQEAYGAQGDRGLHCLLLDDTPLIKYHGEEYLCPTCEKLVSAGCGTHRLAPLMDRYRAAVEDSHASLPQLLAALEPLLGLLPSGCYALADAALYPTDGDGNFFWTVTNSPRPAPATCPYYEGGNWAWETPRFLLPSQPPGHYNPDAARRYRDRPHSRAVAYSLGFLCVLLDGHHKATAAALEGRPVQTLVLLPVTGVSLPGPGNGFQAKLRFGSRWINAAELGIDGQDAKELVRSRRLSETETGRMLARQDPGFDGHQWPEELLATAKHYPHLRTLAYMEWGGDLSGERLDRILSGAEQPQPDEMRYLCTALRATGNPRFGEVAFRAGKEEAYAGIWGELFALLAEIQSEAVEDFFIDFLVNDGGVRPHVTRIAHDYLNNR